MIKLIIFDLDGVLIESKNIHYNALNNAINDIVGTRYIINYQEHINKYDGNPTKIKLKMLNKEKGLDEKYFNSIYLRKQQYTKKGFKTNINRNEKLINLFKTLKENYKLNIASNCIRESTITAINNLGLREYVDYIITNEDVDKPKPHSEMYLKCMLQAGVNPTETLIIEDSYVGRQGAYKSGAFLFPINNMNDLTLEGIMNNVSKKDIKQKWKGSKLNILIPAAGAGSRFKGAGYIFPKPLIDVNGKPMIQVVIENLNIEANYIFVIQKEHDEKYNMSTMLKLIEPDCKIIYVDELTEGAACTTLLAKEYINNDNQLLIANSDQWIGWDSSAFMYAMQQENIDGGILTFKNTHPKWSYAKVDDNGWVSEVAEKKPISDNATVGIYYYKKGSDYVKYAEQMIDKNIRTNNEFYVCPAYNEAIKDKKQIKIWQVNKILGLGTPEDLERNLKCL